MFNSWTYTHKSEPQCLRQVSYTRPYKHYANPRKALWLWAFRGGLKGHYLKKRTEAQDKAKELHTNPVNGLIKKRLEVKILNFEVWVADLEVFDVKFDFGMSKSPRGQILTRFHWIGNGFIRGRFFNKVFLLIRSWGQDGLFTAK